MAKRAIHAPRQFDSGSWIVARYQDTKQLSEVFPGGKVETRDGATGAEINFKIGDECLAPWKRAGNFPAIVAIINDDKTSCLKRKQTMEANEKKSKVKDVRDETADKPDDDNDVVQPAKKKAKNTGKQTNVSPAKNKQAVTQEKKMEKRGKIMAANHAARKILQGITRKGSEENGHNIIMTYNRGHYVRHQVLHQVCLQQTITDTHPKKA
ncbi:uncharacterized protein LOC128553488 [Mercenaria mercenaria]|uniref:uncharacterized protein LOC128553488 n=1 Tax=Mercenaria mercenaria TaxID=6596 RepID=UPI00234F1AA9|nr:uncharacterized protein LOC128553488 [Mercenaria mercenaria]